MDKVKVELTIGQIATILAALDASLSTCRALDNIMALTDAKAAILNEVRKVS